MSKVESTFETSVKTFPRVSQKSAPFMNDEDLELLREPTELQHVEQVGETGITYSFDHHNRTISAGRDDALRTGNTKLQDFLKKAKESQL